MVNLTVDSVDQRGRGVGRINGKVVYIEGALTNEYVAARIVKSKKDYDLAVTENIYLCSSSRTIPSCENFGVCGGCSMQHLDNLSQIATKQRFLEENLRRIGRVRPDIIYPPIHGRTAGYRYRARLSSRYVAKKSEVLVGFREKKRGFVVDMKWCSVLSEGMSSLLIPLRKMISNLTIFKDIPQIEIAGDTKSIALNIRVLEEPSEADKETLHKFGKENAVSIFLQPGGKKSLYPLDKKTTTSLAYELPEFALQIPFNLNDFTQVNFEINEVLVRRVVALLDLSSTDLVADFFCGLGNFSLPIATTGASVIGYEGEIDLVNQADKNARLNQLDNQTKFIQMDLFKADLNFVGKRNFDKCVIDPPRDGALNLVKSFDNNSFKTIVYVSCNPATLARDSEVLVHEKGYRLAGAGIINMFPETSHVEAIALFQGRDEGS